jgi:hypothetical protein
MRITNPIRLLYSQVPRSELRAFYEVERSRSRPPVDFGRRYHQTCRACRGGGRADARHELAIRRALEGAGVLFIEENGGGPGVRLHEQLKTKSRRK